MQNNACKIMSNCCRAVVMSTHKSNCGCEKSYKYHKCNCRSPLLHFIMFSWGFIFTRIVHVFVYMTSPSKVLHLLHTVKFKEKHWGRYLVIGLGEFSIFNYLLTLKQLISGCNNSTDYCFTCSFDLCIMLHTKVAIVSHRSTSGVGVFRDQGLSNNVVVKFIVEFDELFRHDGEPPCTTSSFLQWVSSEQLTLLR